LQVAYNCILRSGKSGKKDFDGVMYALRFSTLAPAFRQGPIRNFLLGGHAVPCLPTHLSMLYRRCNLDAIE
jgi:hypothetical protein